MSESLEIYGFVDERENGAFPVYDVQGAVVARIEPSFWTRKFTAYAADGSVLCEGRAVPMSQAFDVTDASGNVLIELAGSFWSSKKRTITLGTGAEFELRGEPWPSRDWNVTDASGRVVLDIDATAGFWSFHPDAYAVQVADPALTLAHVVGIVESNRILVKQARAN
ncbi:LURP-one-related/scramblase family protein [Jatrophihabitans fulvus]